VAMWPDKPEFKNSTQQINLNRFVVWKTLITND
jgi:hypothetical protein